MTARSFNVLPTKIRHEHRISRRRKRWRWWKKQVRRATVVMRTVLLPSKRGAERGVVALWRRSSRSGTRTGSTGRSLQAQTHCTATGHTSRLRAQHRTHTCPRGVDRNRKQALMWRDGIAPHLLPSLFANHYYYYPELFCKNNKVVKDGLTVCQRRDPSLPCPYLILPSCCRSWTGAILALYGYVLEPDLDHGSTNAPHRPCLRPSRTTE